MYIGEERVQDLTCAMQDFLGKFGDFYTVCFVPTTSLFDLPRIDKRTAYLSVIGEEYDMQVSEPTKMEAPPYFDSECDLYVLPPRYIREFGDTPVEIAMRC